MPPRPHPGWSQVNLRCATWQDAEHAAVDHLHLLLTAAEADGTLASWWFIRKRETWRVRLLPAPGQDQAADALLRRLLALTTQAEPHVQGAVRAVYEPETRRFGGPSAMDIAHTLFHADSRHILAHLAHSAAHGGPDHRREIGIRLATVLMTAAGQDLYEHGDIWATLAEHRTHPAGADTGPQPSPAAHSAVQALITAAGEAPNSPLTRTPAWPTAFRDAGTALAEVTHTGGLTRGLRAVLSDHLIFAFNRLGLPAAEQALLATAAARVIFHRPTPPQRPHPSTQASPTTTLGPVTTTHTTTDPRDLRAALVATIEGFGTFHTDPVRAAFLTVPRHVFLPGVDLSTAYAPKPVVTKRAPDGTALSSASSPNIVATMLEQLAAAPGQRVLEIGAATGINAALLAEILSPTGSVITLELDQDLAEGARTHLADAGYDTVSVLCRDGALGAPEHAPYQRIICTAGAWDIPTAWWQQLAPGGRLVVPLRLHGSGLTRSLAFDLEADGTRMISTNAAVCGFVPLRGAAEMSEDHIRLAEQVILKLDAADHPDHDALASALTHPARQRHTGIQVRHREPVAHLDLWLATADSALSFGKLAVTDTARRLGLADPARRWSGATLYRHGTLAYLTTRPTAEGTDELGITAHGPDATTITDQVSDLLHHWDSQRPAQPIVTAYPTTAPDTGTAPGTHIIRPDTRLTITW